MGIPSIRHFLQTDEVSVAAGPGRSIHHGEADSALHEHLHAFLLGPDGRSIAGQRLVVCAGASL